MLTFVIPVKSKTVTSNWPYFCRLFERTLRSVCNQADPNFKVVVVCHEIPEVQFSHDNIFIIHPEFPPPSKLSSNSSEAIHPKRKDKGEKIKLGVAYAIERFNTDYVMFVDSDDFISNKVAEFVNNSNNDLPGWYVGNGYISYNWKNFILSTKRFNLLCGSSLIVKPKLVEYLFDKDKIDLYFNHKLTALNTTIELDCFPFSAAIYSIGNGENIYMSSQTVSKYNNHWQGLYKQGFRRILNKIKNYRLVYISSKFRKEFQFYSS